MSKVYKCEKCLHEFSRRKHLSQHYSRKIPCVRAHAQVRSSEDAYANILPHGITSGNMIVKILPAERTEDVKLPGNRAEPVPEPTAETISEQKVEITKPNLMPPNLMGNIGKPSLYANGTKYHNKTVKVKSKFQFEYVNLVKINEYDKLFKRVKRYFESEQVRNWLQEENMADPISPNISLDELRGWYRDFKTEIENEYHKIKIIG